MPKFDPSRSKLVTFLSWAYKNHCINEYRKAVRQVRCSELMEETTGADQRQASELELPEIEDECLILHVRGLKMREIAFVLGVPEGTVKSRINRERNRISRRRTED